MNKAYPRGFCAKLRIISRAPQKQMRPHRCSRNKAVQCNKACLRNLTQRNVAGTRRGDTPPLCHPECSDRRERNRRILQGYNRVCVCVRGHYRIATTLRKPKQILRYAARPRKIKEGKRCLPSLNVNIVTMVYPERLELSTRASEALVLSN